MADAESEVAATQVTASMVANGCVEMGRRFRVPDIMLAEQMLAAAPALLVQASSRSAGARIMRGIAAHLEKPLEARGGAHSEGMGAHDLAPMRTTYPTLF